MKHVQMSLIAAQFAIIAPACAATYAPWLTQVGITDAIESAGDWGRGQVLGVVDTGIDLGSPVFAKGQVSVQHSGCTLSPGCSVSDDHGHGTAVAEIAAGHKSSPGLFKASGYTVAVGNVLGIAPNANIVAEKSCDLKGNCLSAHYARGLQNAADAGASVINLSLTFGNVPDVVSAINDAASKGAFIVWAGGNDNQASFLQGLPTTGLTKEAVKHLLYAGSVGPKNSISQFSNTPGAGVFVENASGQVTSYASRWLMAPGESIVAPTVPYQKNTWRIEEGTSMAAPIVSGSLMLLESAWPILKTKGTAADLLLATATDLGAPGVDLVYGAGLLNLGAAFKPVGGLHVNQSNGRSVDINNLTGSMIVGGALGSLSGVKAKLAKYAAFDGFDRNFSVNLSGLIKTKSTSATLNPLPTNRNTGPAIVKFDDGSEMRYVALAAEEDNSVFDRHARVQDARMGYAMLNDKAGNTLAFGYGYPVQNAYARALYGNESMAEMAESLGMANLASLAQGGGLFAYGMKLDDQNRVAFSWSGTEKAGAGAVEALTSTNNTATNLNLGWTHQFDDRVSTTLTVGSLSEQNGLLGSSYDGLFALNLGHRNQTYNVGLGLGVALNKNSSLLFEGGYALTKGGATHGLFTGTRDILSTAYGATFMTRHLLNGDDRLSVSVMQPLRVASGHVGVLTQTVDELGYAHGATEWASLVPSAREIDLKLAYETLMGTTQTLSLQAQYQKDAQHVEGQNEGSVGMSWTIRF